MNRTRVSEISPRMLSKRKRNSMINIRKDVTTTRFWGVALLFLGVVALVTEVIWFVDTGAWFTMTFIDMIKIIGREVFDLRNSEWVYHPKLFVWLYDFLNSLPLTVTLVTLGLIGIFAPDVRPKNGGTVRQFAMLVR